jgi:hypothetical protein
MELRYGLSDVLKGLSSVLQRRANACRSFLALRSLYLRLLAISHILPSAVVVAMRNGWPLRHAKMKQLRTFVAGTFIGGLYLLSVQYWTHDNW